MVIKRESRGGMGGKILPDLYLVRGPFLREWRLACRLSALGLSPPPVAQEHHRFGPLFAVYGASLAVAGGTSLADLWKEGKMDGSPWIRSGEAVGRLHREGILHGDLNAGNLVAGQDGRVLFLDLRHSRTFGTKPGARARAKNLGRLKRSLIKLNATRGLPLPDDVWGLISSGYAEGWGEREPWLEGWEVAAARPFPFRRLFWRRNDF